MNDPAVVAAVAVGLSAVILYVTRHRVLDPYEPLADDPTVRIRRAAGGYDFECVGCGRVVHCLTEDRAWAITAATARPCRCAVSA